MPKYLRKWILLAAALCLLLTGCGQDTSSNETPSESASSGQSQETQQPAGEETAPEETPDKTPAEAPDAQAPEEDAGEQTYTDNFSVDPAAVQAFAQDIQQVVADQDLEGLADLVSFPIYLGFADDPQSVETREDFVALGADRIFTEDLLTEISTADTSALEPSRAGFALSASGRPNIVFGVSNGHLAIVGINY